MGRYEVRGDHKATTTWGTSGRIPLSDIREQAKSLHDSGHVNLVVVDHETGAETPIEDFNQIE